MVKTLEERLITAIGEKRLREQFRIEGKSLFCLVCERNVTFELSKISGRIKEHLATRRHILSESALNLRHNYAGDSLAIEMRTANGIPRYDIEWHASPRTRSTLEDEPPSKQIHLDTSPPQIIVPDIVNDDATDATPPMRLRDFLDEKTTLSEETTLTDQLIIYVPNSDGHWKEVGCPQRIRHLSTVYLDRGVAESMLQDLTEFLTSKCWYEERGVPYQRGYLFHGPPGCGKTSLIKALATELNYSICLLNLSEKKMTDQMLVQLMSSVPIKSFIVFENVDSVFESREMKRKEIEKKENDTNYETLNKVTFNGLLNCIDWIVAPEGRIMFLTTNSIDKLDSDLIRPGRIDRRQLLDYPTDHQLRLVFTRFYPEANVSLLDRFMEEIHVSKLKRSIAEIQGLFTLFKKDPKKAIDHLNI
ncbi:Mitochondrial chaperone BCS1-like protein [Dinothrombium tinctorium]|uniref:Mitochondrial chaperone BCS1-like protein n=1 Tax=Dinothrombium tinctorium TaxID=1965070 RepID=A0A3S3P365_9ACAR|nr:Mitochondrial chaperone BCS1-like protein [Dinothrombium tinctorium]